MPVALAGAHRRTQLPGLRLLRTRNGERALEICSRLRRTQLRQLQRDFALYAIDFCLVPPFLCSVHCSHRFANVAPSHVKQAEPACALDKWDKKHGKYTLDPVDRYVVIPDVIIWIASQALPDSANTQPFCIVPRDFHNAAPFSSANRTTSLDCAFAAAYFVHSILVNDVCNCAYIKVPAWPLSRA